LLAVCGNLGTDGAVSVVFDDDPLWCVFSRRITRFLLLLLLMFCKVDALPVVGGG